MNLNVQISPITKLSSDGNTAHEGVKNVDLMQAKVCFSDLPKTPEDIASADRSGANGKFVTMALAIASFACWTPETQENCCAMLANLLNSPTCGMTFNNFGKQFIKDRMMQNNKYPYLGNAYFDGATPGNGYAPSEPRTVTLEEYVYNLPASTMYGPTLAIERVVTRFQGADTERYMDLYEDPKDGKWYIWSDTYKGLLADIKPC